MGKKLSIRKLVGKTGGSSSKDKSKDSTRQSGEWERWQAFEKRLAELMADKSPSPALLNDAGDLAKTEEVAPSQNLPSPAKGIVGSEQQHDLPSSKQRPPRQRSTSLRQAPTSPKVPDPRPISPEHQLASPQNKKGNRNRTLSSECESSFASDVKIVHTRSAASKKIELSKPNPYPTMKKYVIVPPKSKKYNWKTGLLHLSNEGSTELSSHGYSSEGEDSLTYATKETFYTFNSFEEVSGFERVMLRLAYMFVCDFDDGSSGHGASRVK